MAALVVTSIFVLMAILSPILKRLGVLDPYTFHTRTCSTTPAAASPRAFGGGISIHHPLGVEPAVGP